MNVLIGIGGNVGDARATLQRAADRLADRFGLGRVSGLWRTTPLGPPQADYLNAAVVVSTGHSPLRVLAVCRAIEDDAGRDRGREQRWGPRPLDLDLLLAEGLVMESPVLTLPHPRLHERRFALLPACELTPGWIHPRRHASLATLLSALDPAEQPCERLGELFSPQA